jgi:RNA polymerase sigma-70 factor (ECF subfamily)
MRAHHPTCPSGCHAFPRPHGRHSPSDAPSEGRHATCATARQTLPMRANLFEPVPTCSNAPTPNAPAQNEPRPCNPMQPNATDSKTAKRSQVPICHTPTPPSKVCQISKRTHRPCHTPPSPLHVSRPHVSLLPRLPITMPQIFPCKSPPPPESNPPVETMTDPVDPRPMVADQPRTDVADGDATAVDAGPDDPTLAARFARGEPGAFEAVVDRFHPRVHRLAYRLLGWSADDADDVAQEVFLAALRNARKFRGQSSLGTWLTTITINHCRTHRRGLLARLRLATRFASTAPPRPEAPPADAPAADADAFAHVQSALRHLSPPDREIIVLHYLEQNSADQLAALLGLTRGAVDVRLHRARKRLREVLGVPTPEETR